MDGIADGGLFRQAALIDGMWITGDGLVVTDPADGAVLGRLPAMGGAETARAIRAAEDGFARWRRVAPGARAEALMRWHDLMIGAADDLAMILTREQGKPLAEARAEILYGASFVKWFAEEARRIDGRVIPSEGGRRILTLPEPVGVCGILTPWNFPNAMITRKVAPALAAGCSVVVKPSDLTPFSALALAVLAERAGIPPGVINIVTGLPEGIGAELTANPAVRKISFTGSTRIGSLLMAQCAPTVKRISLELGGNGPFIVFDDADADRAAEAIMQSKFRNGGQTCVCANRILVQSGIHDAVVARLAARIATLRVGRGTEAGVEIGPMINASAVTKIGAHVADAMAGGAAVAARAAAPDGPGWAAPLLLTGAGPQMVLAREETFGPVAPIFRFDAEEEAVALANATPFGLAAYFFTESQARTWRVAEALDFGMVGLNTGSVSTTVAPFGGVKASGLGREGGREGIAEYLETKALHMVV